MGTRLTTWFYAIHCMLCLKRALKVIVYRVSFVSLVKHARVVPTVEYIEDDMFWRAIFCLLRAVFAALKTLRFCDSNQPMMDKILFFVNCSDCAQQISAFMLDDETLFGRPDLCNLTGYDEELDEVFGKGNE